MTVASRKITFVCFDEAYVGTIEYKLAEILNDKADLEFITNEAYLIEFLHNDRQTDILLMPKKYENLLNEQFKNVKIIWLTEDKELSASGNNYGEEYMYLYTSVRSMIDQMDANFLKEISTGTKNGTQIVSIFSVSGGCGKTMAALGITYALAKEGNKVLYVSTESMQDYKFYKQDVKEITSDFGYQCAVDMEMAKRCVLNEIEHGDIDYLRPFSVLPMSYQVGVDKYFELINGIIESNIYDYIVVELSKEIEPKKITFMQKGHRTVLVTRQGEYEVLRLADFINNITKFSAMPLIVCNRFDRDKLDYLQKSELTKRCEVAEYIMEADHDISWEEVKSNGLFEKVATLL